jgi:hypothetical protein
MERASARTDDGGGDGGEVCMCCLPCCVCVCVCVNEEAHAERACRATDRAARQAAGSVPAGWVGGGGWWPRGGRAAARPPRAAARAATSAGTRQGLRPPGGQGELQPASSPRTAHRRAEFGRRRPALSKAARGREPLRPPVLGFKEQHVPLSAKGLMSVRTRHTDLNPRPPSTKHALSAVKLKDERKSRVVSLWYPSGIRVLARTRLSGSEPLSPVPFARCRYSSTLSPRSRPSRRVGPLYSGRTMSSLLHLNELKAHLKSTPWPHAAI